MMARIHRPKIACQQTDVVIGRNAMTPIECCSAATHVVKYVDPLFGPDRKLVCYWHGKLVNRFVDDSVTAPRVYRFRKIV